MHSQYAYKQMLRFAYELPERDHRTHINRTELLVPTDNLWAKFPFLLSVLKNKGFWSGFCDCIDLRVSFSKQSPLLFDVSSWKLRIGLWHCSAL